jgi:disulfide bond formation protein DsbB
MTMKSALLSVLLVLLSRSCVGMSKAPTESPVPTPSPSLIPTSVPTSSPAPSAAPTISVRPSLRPSQSPSKESSVLPTDSPAPSPSPTHIPSMLPSNVPSTSQLPSSSHQPSSAPTRFTVVMSAPITVSIPAYKRSMKEDEQKAFAVLVLQFLMENRMDTTMYDIEVMYTLVIVHMQAMLRGPPPPRALSVTIVVSADVFSPTAQEIHTDFDYRDFVQHAFDTNMTGFLDMLPRLKDLNFNGAASFNNMADEENRTIGIIIICIAVLTLLAVLLLIFSFCVRKRRKDAIDKASIKLAAQRSWETEESAVVAGGLEAGAATRNVHKCSSATCAQCSKNKKTNNTKFVRLTPRSTRWSTIWKNLPSALSLSLSFSGKKGFWK